MTKLESYYKEICQSQFNKHDAKSLRILKCQQFLLVVLSKYAYSVKGSVVNIYQSWRHAWKVYTDIININSQVLELLQLFIWTTLDLHSLTMLKPHYVHQPELSINKVIVRGSV